MDTNTFENWSALESRALDDRRIERERVEMREAQIDVHEWSDVIYRGDFAREYHERCTALGYKS